LKGTRNYKKEYARDHSSPRAKKQRAARNKARAQAMASGVVRKGDGKEIDHKRPLSKGGSNAKSNRRVVSRRTNRKKGSK
jgi:5-methylcytosine-specific restriction endonuclease McrA